MIDSNNRQVAPERTGWRDEQISLRHRHWGFDCPAVDLDFLMVEYDSGKVCAIVEYKNEFAAVQYSSHPSYKAIRGLANKAKIPFFACRYSSDFSSWKVTPINHYASKYLTEPVELSEKGWVELLYRIRGRVLKTDLFEYPI